MFAAMSQSPDGQQMNEATLFHAASSVHQQSLHLLQVRFQPFALPLKITSIAASSFNSRWSASPATQSHDTVTWGTMSTTGNKLQIDLSTSSV